MKQTRFGAIETDFPELYKNPIPGKTILEIDALRCLGEKWGDSVLCNRDLLYKIVSGNYKTEEEYRRLLLSFYAKHPKFTQYIDEVINFGNKKTDLITRIIKPIRERIDSEIESIEELASITGGKLVMVTHDFVYLIYKHDNLPAITARIIR
jgi:hypothetical protein